MKLFTLVSGLVLLAWASILAQPRLSWDYKHFLMAKQQDSDSRTWSIPDDSTRDTSAPVSFKPGAVVYSAVYIDWDQNDSVDTRVVTQVAFDRLKWIAIDSVSITDTMAVSQRKHRTDTIACNEIRWITTPITGFMKADTTDSGDNVDVRFNGRCIIVEP